MNSFNKDNKIIKQPQGEVPIDDLMSDDQMRDMMQGENKLFDLQKEHFNNVRTLVTAAAAIASVDLLALQALKDIGLGNWFLTSVVFLYLASIIFVLYLTYSSNVQTKQIIEKSKMFETVVDIGKNAEAEMGLKMQNMLEISNKYLTQATKTTLTMQKATKMLTLGNILFTIGLLIPVIGFIKSLFA